MSVGLSLLLLVLSPWVAPMSPAAEPLALEEQARSLAAELRCPVCQNLSVADSPSEMAQQMRALILDQLKEGKSPDEIRAYFVSKYGEWVLLAPSLRGFSLLVWVFPFMALAGGIILVVFTVRSWVNRRSDRQTPEAEPGMIERVEREVGTEGSWEIPTHSEGSRASLQHERARLYTDIRELEFDFQAGKLSEADYLDLRGRYAAQAATVLKELDASPAPGVSVESQGAVAGKEAGKAPSRRGWVFAASGALLLIFGVTLGVMLGSSLRPRGSAEESITGDFLTGTGPGGIGESLAGGGGDLQSVLQQGRAAFEREDWPAAIEAFKRVVAIDPNQPEAHSYMGLILARAGHADGALSAFGRALSVDPDFPLALFGKGMVLYRDKGDLTGARENLERLAGLLPPGADRDRIRQTIDEMGGAAEAPKAAGPAIAESGRIRGVVSIDPGLEKSAGERPVLFIIVRSASSKGGPPLAVKRVDRPAFPLSYSLGSENVMIPGTSFSGKVVVTARLDKDGNPGTREPGSSTGSYKQNPVEVGSANVDIVIDQAL